jgi:hypothetical protein
MLLLVIILILLSEQVAAITDIRAGVQAVASVSWDRPSYYAPAVSARCAALSPLATKIQPGDSYELGRNSR